MMITFVKIEEIEVEIYLYYEIHCIDNTIVQ